MIISVDLKASGSAVELREPDDFRSFKVVTREVTEVETERLDDVLRDVGWMTHDGDIFVEVRAVRRLAGDASMRPDWIASFDEMLRYAEARGWLSPDGQAIRAHREAG